MGRLLLLNLLFTLHFFSLYSQINGSVTNTIDPCTDYWELSYRHSYLDKADRLYSVERFTEALALYQLAAERFEQQQNWEGLLKARNRWADCLRFTSRRDSAFPMLQENLEIIEKHLGNNPSELAEVHFITGICYDWDGQKEKALAEYNQSLGLRIDLFGENHIDVARGYRGIGDMLAFDDQNLKALEYLSKADDILASLNCENSTAVGDIYYSLASTYRGMRDLEKAEIYGLKTLSLFENNPFKKSRCYSLIANVLQDKNEFEKSLSYNAIAINLLQEHKPLSISQQRNLANYLQSIGSIHTSTHNYHSAHKYYQQSLEIYHGINDQNGVILAYQNIGTNYYGLGHYDSANYYLSRAIALRKRIHGPKHFRTSASLRAKGTFYENLGQLDSALYYHQQAIIAGSGPEFISDKLSDNPTLALHSHDDDGNLLQALYSKGKVLHRTYTTNKDLKTLELSLETLLLAMELMDQNQQLYLLEGSTLLMAEDYYGLFEEALNLCYSLYKFTGSNTYLETAFFVIESSKARLLFDTFSDLQQSRMVGVPDSLIHLENNIRSRMDSVSRDLENEKASSTVDVQKIRNLEDQLFEATVALDEFKESLEAAYPSYASALENELLDLSRIQHQSRQENQTLINYFWGDSSIFSVVLRGQQIDFFKKPIKAVNQLVLDYQRHLLTPPQFSNQESQFRDYVKTAQDLYQQLFYGIELEGNALVIAADGPLRFIPFEGLVITQPVSPNNDYSKLDYLVNHFSTSYVYSANLWAMAPTAQRQKLKVLGFSHSDPNPQAMRGKNELSGTAVEIELLKGQLQGQFFSGLKATKQQFLNQAGDFDIVHLAIHGISDTISRLNNRLLFRTPDDQNKSDPLYTYELYNLRLTARLAVLSACESGTGRNFRGEGVYSMSRAFSYAGCPTTVMSLWKISDKTTPEILGQFYHQIKNGEGVDQALRGAKLKYLSENSGALSHPNYWAAMVVHGTTMPVVKPSNTWLFTAIALTALILAIVVIKALKKRKDPVGLNLL